MGLKTEGGIADIPHQRDQLEPTCFEWHPASVLPPRRGTYEIQAHGVSGVVRGRYLGLGVWQFPGVFRWRRLCVGRGTPEAARMDFQRVGGTWLLTETEGVFALCRPFGFSGELLLRRGHHDWAAGLQIASSAPRWGDLRHVSSDQVATIWMPAGGSLSAAEALARLQSTITDSVSDLRITGADAVRAVGENYTQGFRVPGDLQLDELDGRFRVSAPVLPLGVRLYGNPAGKPRSAVNAFGRSCQLVERELCALFLTLELVLEGVNDGVTA